MNTQSANPFLTQLPGIEIVKDNIDLILATTTACAYWKDKKGRYLGVNDTFVQVTDVAAYDNVIGLKDRDLWKNQAAVFEQNDQAIMHTGVSKTFMESALCGKDKKTELILSHKTPLKTATGKIIGIFGLSFLLPKTHPDLSPITESLDVSFTQRQLDCLIHLVKGKTIKQIAQSLHLSAKTVEHYLDAIKIKLHAQDRSVLIEKALLLTAIRERL